MHLEEWVRKDMKRFIKEHEPEIETTTQVRHEDTAITRVDYQRQIQRALKQHRFREATNVFNDLKEEFLHLPKEYGEQRKQYYRILQKCYKEIYEYVEDRHKTNRLLQRLDETADVFNTQVRTVNLKEEETKEAIPPIEEMMFRKKQLLPRIDEETEITLPEEPNTKEHSVLRQLSSSPTSSYSPSWNTLKHEQTPPKNILAEKNKQERKESTQKEKRPEKQQIIPEKKPSQLEDTKEKKHLTDFLNTNNEFSPKWQPNKLPKKQKFSKQQTPQEQQLQTPKTNKQAPKEGSEQKQPAQENKHAPAWKPTIQPRKHENKTNTRSTNTNASPPEFTEKPLPKQTNFSPKWKPVLTRKQQETIQETTPQTTTPPERILAVEELTRQAQQALQENDLEEAKTKLLEARIEYLRTRHEKPEQLSKIEQLERELVIHKYSKQPHQQIDKEFFSSLYTKGLYAMRNGDYKTATQLFSKRVNQAPYDIAARIRYQECKEALHAKTT
ncbi:MAG: hypothetical protein ACMXYD_02385 [Candidatus Woesearchaeota archaeon]